MDAAIRWSPHATAQKPHFLLIDVSVSRLRLCSINSSTSNPIKYQQICQREKLPSYTAFDWSKTDPFIVALGGGSGEANIVQIDPDKTSQDGEYSWAFPIKHQRRCNSIAFSAKNLLATGLDRVRNDFCMNVYDLNSPAGFGQVEPQRKLASSEAITSIKFFSSQPETLVAGVFRQCIRIYDLRDSSTSGAVQFPTRQAHNLAIDPLDENYFISAGPQGDPVVNVWDRRFAPKANPTAPQDGGPAGLVLEIRPAVDNSHNPTIWSLRFSGMKRGCFGIFSSLGEVKVVELAQHSVKQGLVQPPVNPNGGIPWTSRTYTRRTHNLAYSIHDPYHPASESTQVIAYDFMSTGNITRGQSILSLHHNRDISMVKIHDLPRKVNITAFDEICLWKNRRQFLKPRDDFDTSAEELMALQEKAKHSEGSRRTSEQAVQDSAARLEVLSIDNFGHKAPPSYESPYYPSSGDKHEDLLTLYFPGYSPTVGDALKALRTQRRRCHEGYLLDPARNIQVVANDPWLVDMWDMIRRFEDLARNEGMYHEGLDLSYLGVYGIWNGDFGEHRNRTSGTKSVSRADFTSAVKAIVTSKSYPPYQGFKTNYPELRQLCLAICGWTFSKDRLRPRCKALMEKGQHYKAIVVAVMRGFKDLAQELLKSAIQAKAVQNIGLGAVIACESVYDEQRELCEWMAEETDDPYLKALLAFFVSGDWKVVADMPLLPLSDRIGVAVKYLDDERLGEFIKLQTASAILIGNTEGLVLTGLTDRAMDIFRHYIAKFNDLQTAVLAMSITHPIYLEDQRFELWKDTYLMQMQSWRAFNERTAYLDAHTRRSIARNGAHFGDTPSRPPTLRCAHCLSSLAPHVLTKGAATPTNGASNGTNGTNGSIGTLITVSAPKQPFHNSPAAHSGLVCPRCGRRMPHCGICGLLLGSPDPRRLTGAAAQLLAQEDPVSRLPLSCMTCTHTFHGHHARDWFARHKMCPVPDCQCMCGFLH